MSSIAEPTISASPSTAGGERLLKLYPRVFTRLKGRLKYVKPSFRICQDKSHDSHNQTSSAGVFTGDNWSGGVVQPPQGQSFRQVLGHWVVPNAYPQKSGGLFLNSYWIGLDGFSGPGANEGLQAGVE
jgi:hypothetical protein